VVAVVLILLSPTVWRDLVGQPNAIFPWLNPTLISMPWRLCRRNHRLGSQAGCRSQAKFEVAKAAHLSGRGRGITFVDPRIAAVSNEYSNRASCRGATVANRVAHRICAGACNFKTVAAPLSKRRFGIYRRVAAGRISRLRAGRSAIFCRACWAGMMSRASFPF
jgi:hypothetical protein